MIIFTPQWIASAISPWSGKPKKTLLVLSNKATDNGRPWDFGLFPGNNG